MKCTKDGITTYVAPRTQAGSQKDGKFRKSKFTYNKNSDTYICPQGNVLSTNGKLYTKKRKGKKESPEDAETILSKKLDEESTNIYKSQLNSLLQEGSYSFGFKPFSDISDYILDKLSELYQNEIICDYTFDCLVSINIKKDNNDYHVKLLNEEDLYNFLNYSLIKNLKSQDYNIINSNGINKLQCNKFFNKTEKLMDLLEEIMKKLTKIEYELGEKFKLMLTDLQEDTSQHSFYPAYNIKEFIYTNVDGFILRKENNWNEFSEEKIKEFMNNGNGLFYLYCEEGEFGIKDKSIYKLNEELLKLNSFNSFKELIKEFSN